MRRPVLIAVTSLITTAIFAVSCSNQAGSSGASAKDTSAPARSSAAAVSASSPDSIVRGTVKEMSDSVLTLSAPSGDVRIDVTQPLKVYAREPGDLSRVTEHAFVGITSIPQPDGSQRATEIHVFPEELRGLGEGSRPMGQQGDGHGTMTNGNVANSRMTNGAARMTNGTTHGAAAGTVTVDYNGGSQTITVPPNVPVTVIAATNTKLTAGMSVIVPAKKEGDGKLGTSMVMLAAARGR